MTIFTTLLIIYLVSVLWVYNYIRIIHSKGGAFDGCTTGTIELVWTFLPVINTMFGVVCWFARWPYRKKIKVIFDYDRFFNIRK